jgi:DNA-binding XRE family transcriptional regulator
MQFAATLRRYEMVLKAVAMHHINRNDASLAERCKEYRKATRMPQWVLAEILGLHQKEISRIELSDSTNEEAKAMLREYLKDAPRPRKVRAVNRQLSNIYLTQKLLVWAEKANMSTEGLEAVRALKAAYDTAKRDFGLASIPLIQLEVENALTLATRGRYHRARREGKL